MVITVANHKGGVGKTTTATTLAHLLALEGAPVALVDLDAPGANKSAGAAASYRTAQALDIPAYLLEGIPDELPEWVVIDTPPDAGAAALRNAVELADLTIVPSSPSYYDLQTALSFIDEALGTLPYALLLTRVHPSATANAAELAAGLREDGYSVLKPFVRSLEVFTVAPSLGTTVAGVNTVAGRRAARDYMAVLEAVRGWVSA